MGGAGRSTVGGAAWQSLLDIEHDVQVLALPVGPGLMLGAAADGFGLTENNGKPWRWDNVVGLHAQDCRALVDDPVLLSASAGPGVGSATFLTSTWFGFSMTTAFT